MLKPTAVPRYLPNCPRYLSSIKPPCRRTSATAEARLKGEAKRLSDTVTKMIQRESVKSISELHRKFKYVTLPEGFHRINSTDCLLFAYIPTAFSFAEVPRIECAVRILPDLSVEMFV